MAGDPSRFGKGEECAKEEEHHGKSEEETEEEQRQRKGQKKQCESEEKEEKEEKEEEEEELRVEEPAWREGVADTGRDGEGARGWYGILSDKERTKRELLYCIRGACVLPNGTCTAAPEERTRRRGCRWKQ